MIYKFQNKYYIINVCMIKPPLSDKIKNTLGINSQAK